jgi:hypothetical protein
MPALCSVNCRNTARVEAFQVFLRRPLRHLPRGRHLRRRGGHGPTKGPGDPFMAGDVLDLHGLLLPRVGRLLSPLHSRLQAIVAPLTKLLRKEAFHWTTDTKASFRALQRTLTMAPVFQLPNFNAELVMECDASSMGISTVLH